jgi:hypothetical protein
MMAAQGQQALQQAVIRSYIEAALDFPRPGFKY